MIDRQHEATYGFLWRRKHVWRAEVFAAKSESFSMSDTVI